METQNNHLLVCFITKEEKCRQTVLPIYKEITQQGLSTKN